MALILVADDDRDLAETLARLLSSRGHRVVTAKDGAEAILKTQEWRPDLILMDIMMPGVIGTSAYHSLSSAGVAKDTPVIFMTGLSREKARKLLPKAPKARLLFKPLEPAALLKLIGEMLPPAG